MLNNFKLFLYKYQYTFELVLGNGCLVYNEVSRSSLMMNIFNRKCLCPPTVAVSTRQMQEEVRHRPQNNKTPSEDKRIKVNREQVEIVRGYLHSFIVIVVSLSPVLSYFSEQKSPRKCEALSPCASMLNS